MSEKHKIIRILITEDDDGHAELITEGLRDPAIVTGKQIGRAHV